MTGHELKLAVQGRSRDQNEQAITAGWLAGYYGRVKHFPQSLAEEIKAMTGGGRSGRGRPKSAADYTEEDIVAADARIMAWAKAEAKAQGLEFEAWPSEE